MLFCVLISLVLCTLDTLTSLLVRRAVVVVASLLPRQIALVGGEGDVPRLVHRFRLHHSTAPKRADGGLRAGLEDLLLSECDLSCLHLSYSKMRTPEGRNALLYRAAQRVQTNYNLVCRSKREGGGERHKV